MGVRALFQEEPRTVGGDDGLVRFVRPVGLTDCCLVTLRWPLLGGVPWRFVSLRRNDGRGGDEVESDVSE